MNSSVGIQSNYDLEKIGYICRELDRDFTIGDPAIGRHERGEFWCNQNEYYDVTVECHFGFIMV